MASQLEFDTVLHVLDKYLPPACTVLDLAESLYSPHLLHRGFRVVSLQPTDMTHFDVMSDKNFQAVLCLGPYYHLRSRDKRRKCLLECRRVLGEHGIVAVSYLNRAFAIGQLVRDGVRLSEAQYRALHQRVENESETLPLFEGAYFTSPEEVDAEVRSCGYGVLEHVGVDGVFDYFPGAFENLGLEAYRDFLWYHLSTCSQPSALGHSRHGLVLLRKE